MASLESDPSKYTVANVREMLYAEEEAYGKQLPEMVCMLDAKRDNITKLMKEIREQEKKLETVQKDVETVRGGIDRRRNKSPSEATENLDELKKGATQALPIFIQTITQYNLSEEVRKEKGGSKLKFWKKGKDDSSSQPRNLSLTLDIPTGCASACKNPASGFSVALTCKEPEKSIEDLAQEGGSITLTFDLKDSRNRNTDTILESAKKYFEEYFAARAKEEGATPEIDIKVTETMLIATARLSVSKDKLGGVIGKLERLLTGEIIEGRTKKDIFGKYSEDQVKDALSQLRHTRATGNFASEVSFSDLMSDGKINWNFFERVTGTGGLVLEKCVYKAVQKVVDVFNSVAATKMSLGGKFFRRLNFKVDGLIFKAIREDQELVEAMEQTIDSTLGTSVVVTPEILEHLEVLSSSLSFVRGASIDLPALSLQVQFQGFDFFEIINGAAKLAVAKQAELEKGGKTVL